MLERAGRWSASRGPGRTPTGHPLVAGTSPAASSVSAVLHTPRRVRHRFAVVVTGVAVLGLALMDLAAPLNANLRYEAGVKIAGTDTAAGTFSHRPLAYRLVMDAVFRSAHLLSTGAVTFELAVRVLLALLALGAGFLLRQGLARHRVAQPGLHAAVAVGGLVMLGLVSAGEPDWLAVVFTLAGVGVALLGDRGRPWLYATSAGILFVAAAGMKIVTLPLAIIGLVVTLVVDRRLAGRALVASLGVGVLYVIATVLWVPWEIQWLLDLRAVQNGARDGLVDAGPYAVALVAQRPVLALLPAAAILAAGRERALVLGASAVTAGLIVAQGQYFAYHAVPLVVVAAVAVFRVLRDRLSTVAGATLLAVAVILAGLSAVDPVWAVDHERLRAGGLAAFALTSVIWALGVRARPTVRRPGRAAYAALITLALVVPGATPWSAQLLRAENTDGTRPPNAFQLRTARTATAERVHRVIGGPDVDVTYLTSGEWTYWLQNPTRCRYPSPLFLQRTRKPARLLTASYRENVGCLTDPAARWLIIETAWFIPGRQPADVRGVLARHWDCQDATTTGGLRLCPRRV